MLFGTHSTRLHARCGAGTELFKFILNGNVLCLIKGARLKMIKELIIKVRLKEKSDSIRKIYNYYFMIDEIEF